MITKNANLTLMCRASLNRGEGSYMTTNIIHRRQRGFTLIEIMIVMLILAILASIVVLAVQSMESQTATASCMADFKTIETAQEAYTAQVGVPATNLTQMLQQQPTSLAGGPVGPWLKELPNDPSHYVIGIDNGSIPGGVAGRITVASVKPAHAAQDGNANCDFA